MQRRTHGNSPPSDEIDEIKREEKTIDSLMAFKRDMTLRHRRTTRGEKEGFARERNLAELYHTCLPAIYKNTKRLYKQFGKAAELDELLAMSLFILCEYGWRWDPDRGYSFLTYVIACINSKVKSLLKKHKPWKESGWLPIKEAIDKEDDGAGTAYERRDTELYVEWLLRWTPLSPKEREVLREIYWNGKMGSELAREKKKTTAWASKVHMDALKKLRRTLRNEPCPI